MIFWNIGNVTDPQELLCFTLALWKVSKNKRQFQIIKKYAFWGISKSQNLDMLEKTRAEKSSRTVLSDFENLEYGINSFQKA